MRYMIRHAGASNDLLKHKRPREEVKARGRWMTESSLNRYGKAAKALRAAHKLSPSLLQYGEKIRDQLELILMRQAPVPKPPTWGP